MYATQDVLDLIEGKLGILDLLDEQCRWGEGARGRGTRGRGRWGKGGIQ